VRVDRRFEVRPVGRFVVCGSLADRLNRVLFALPSGGPGGMTQQAHTTPTRTQAQRPARSDGAANRAATAAPPATPEARHAVRDFSLFINPNATRIARAAFRFDTGHSL
jgi:hypothetical protein